MQATTLAMYRLAVELVITILTPLATLVATSIVVTVLLALTMGDPVDRQVNVRAAGRKASGRWFRKLKELVTPDWINNDPIR